MIEKVILKELYGKVYFCDLWVRDGIVTRIFELQKLLASTPNACL